MQLTLNILNFEGLNKKLRDIEKSTYQEVRFKGKSKT